MHMHIELSIVRSHPSCKRIYNIHVSPSPFDMSVYRQLQQIAGVQMVLEDNHAILKVLPHLSKNQDKLIREILSFMSAMLYGGNTQVSTMCMAQEMVGDYYFLDFFVYW